MHVDRLDGQTSFTRYPGSGWNSNDVLRPSTVRKWGSVDPSCVIVPLPFDRAVIPTNGWKTGVTLPLYLISRTSRHCRIWLSVSPRVVVRRLPVTVQLSTMLLPQSWPQTWKSDPADTVYVPGGGLVVQAAFAGRPTVIVRVPTGVP